jgi:RNA polymerase sigma-70 factor (ECF subfamily)
MDAADDADLMLRFQQASDYGAFESLFARHRDSLLRFLARFTREPAMAEDACQHTWLKVIDAARQGTYEGRPGVTFRTWLFTLARNHFIDEYQRKAAHTRTVPLSPDLGQNLTQHPDPSVHPQLTAQAGPPDFLLEQQQATLVRLAMRELPFEQREVMWLWAAGVDLDGIAHMTGAPRDTVLSRKRYALAKLRAVLGPQQREGLVRN